MTLGIIEIMITVAVLCPVATALAQHLQKYHSITSGKARESLMQMIPLSFTADMLFTDANHLHLTALTAFILLSNIVLRTIL